MNKVKLNTEQLESLRQYANEAKYRPAQFDTEWRDVPTSQEEFDRLTDNDKVMWLDVANTF